MIVAIDGPAGSGKSTVAHAIARRMGFVYLDTGAMYRAVTEKCLLSGTDVSDGAAVAGLARKVLIEFSQADDGTQKVLLDGRDVTAAIRTPEVDACVSEVSAYPDVRAAMVERQRELARGGDVVAEGRDIGTTVFPQAEVKVFLTASDVARAHRRAVQRSGGDAATDPSATTDAATESKVLESLRHRDGIDSSRASSPLRAAPDAHRIDSSELSLDEVVSEVMSLVERAREAKGAPEAPAAPPKPAAAGARRATREEPMPSHGATDEDYFEHGMTDFPAPARFLYHFVCAVVGAFTKVVWPWTIENGRYLWSHTEGHGSVVIMNHVSMLDPVVVAVSMWFHHRRLRILYKSEFDGSKVVGALFARVGGIPVERGTADLKAIRRAQRALQRGESLLVFPEGTRVRSDDQQIDIRGGFSLIAQMAKADIVPIAIVGARRITPEGTHWKLPGRVFCKVGEALTFDQLESKGRKARLEEMEAKAMERVYELRGDLREEHPGKE
ncbi:MAG: (d)CMP kinase [Atopobiaceae bacterium]|jgi:cytidylate kinase|nr:(d)CMP kinase [Atopobiaceae bacterium]